MVNQLRTIRNIKLNNFKGYRCRDDALPKPLDLDADLVLITGKNGVGKTSLLEALDWVLNHNEESAGDYITERESNGSVCVNDKVFSMQGNGQPDRKSLNTVASFFFQENIAELACADIIQLLEPDNKPAEVIKQSLRSLQSNLESWQRQLQRMKYRKNYDEERKLLAGKINQLVAMLPKESLLRLELEEKPLVINNGNLQSRWDSQIRNLSSSIGIISNLTRPVSDKLTNQLEYIGQSLLEFRGSPDIEGNASSKLPAVSSSFISTLKSLPENINITSYSPKIDQLVADFTKNIYIDTAGDVYYNTIESLDRQVASLRDDHQKISLSLERLEGEGGLSAWLSSFSDNIDDWLGALSERHDESKLCDLKNCIQKNLDDFSKLNISRIKELKAELQNIENKASEIALQLDQAKRSQRLANDIKKYVPKWHELVSKPNFTVVDLESYVSSHLLPSYQIEISEHLPRAETEISHELGNVFLSWSKLEEERVNDEINSTDADKIELAEQMLSGALSICRQESGARSRLLSLVGVIPKAELVHLLKTMNNLLEIFHFPDEFLPIGLVNIGTEKKQIWNFKTNNGVNFSDLSTGQKSQLAICWTINLNLALTEKLGHKVIGFDDFTTSLDMNQLIPAAVLLRKLAYADTGDRWKRQVIVTSHHEDLTNRLLDFLLPPNDKTMKVIQFENWSVGQGPAFTCYKVDMGSVRVEGLEKAVQRIAENV